MPRIMGMMGEEFLAQTAPVKMHIYLCGGDGFMAQHLLYGPEICSSFKKMGGE